MPPPAAVPVKTGNLSPEDIAACVINAGFTGHAQVIFTAIAWAESRGDAGATSKNPSGGTNRGIFQIDSVSHPDVSDDAAFTPVRAAQAAYEISKQGTDIKPWAGDGYQLHMHRAQKAVTNMKQSSGGASAWIARSPQLSLAAPGIAGIKGSDIPGVSAAKGLLDDALALPKFLAKLADPNTLKRIAQVVAGIIAGLVGVILIARGMGMTPPASSIAAAAE